MRLVNQPVLAGWRDGQLYLEVHPPLAEEQHDLVAEADAALNRALERAGAAAAAVTIDRAAIEKIVAEQRGIPLPVLRASRSLEQYLASARIVENTVPIALAEETARLVGAARECRAAEHAPRGERAARRSGMIPIRDDNPVRGLPVVTILPDPRLHGRLPVAVVAAAAGEASGDRPCSASCRRCCSATRASRAIRGCRRRGSIFTAMFLHGGFFHLAGNMLYLWIFGDNVEDRVGRGRFLAFYLICGGVAALAQALPDVRSTVPMIGASGAVSGVLGAYFVLYPRASVLVAMPFLLARVPALVMLGLWFAGQLARSLLIEPGAGGVAFAAHVGGFVGGAVLIRWFLRDRRKRPA